MTPPNHRFQRGTFVVEFAIIFIILLMLLFGIFELARLVYLYNTLQDATRRAAFSASVTDYRDQAAMSLLRQRAIFRDSPGELILGAPVTDRHILIDYLALVRNGDSSQTMTPIPAAAMPACPARNRVTCTANPNDAQCVRLVRVRICAPGDVSTCQSVRYAPLFGMFPAGAKLPVSTTIVAAETLGFLPGSPPCP